MERTRRSAGPEVCEKLERLGMDFPDAGRFELLGVQSRSGTQFCLLGTLSSENRLRTISLHQQLGVGLEVAFGESYGREGGFNGFSDGAHFATLG